MGKADKEHRKKVKARNQRMKGLFQRQVNMAYEKHKEWKEQKELDANKGSDNKSIPTITFK